MLHEYAQPIVNAQAQINRAVFALNDSIETEKSEKREHTTYITICCEDAIKELQKALDIINQTAATGSGDKEYEI